MEKSGPFNEIGNSVLPLFLFYFKQIIQNCKCNIVKKNVKVQSVVLKNIYPNCVTYDNVCPSVTDSSNQVSC